MKIGIHSVDFSYPTGSSEIYSKLKEIAETVDKGGFYSLWPMDHFFQIGVHGPPEDPMIESYTMMSYIAGLTKKIKLGTLVTGVVYRHPGILVKTSTTLDILSNGRSYLGIGAAWNEKEALGLGVPFPPLKERFERLEETLQIAKQMWSENNGAYSGKYYQLNETLCVPQPVAKPHPPILIGGQGEKKTLRLVAQYADACNLIGTSGNDVLKHKLSVLQKHCENLGRKYDDIEKTCLKSVNFSKEGETKEKIITNTINDLKELRKIGFTHVIYTIEKDFEITPLDIFNEEIIPAVADL